MRIDLWNICFVCNVLQCQVKQVESAVTCAKRGRGMGPLPSLNLHFGRGRIRPILLSPGRPLIGSRARGMYTSLYIITQIVNSLVY